MRFFILSLCLLFSVNASAQFVSIPDTNFRNWLNSNGFSPCMSGNFMDTTCAQVLNADTILIAFGSGVKNLEGIQYFDNLIYLQYNNAPGTSINKKLDTIPALPALVKRLEFYHQSLSTFPALPDSLEYLTCYECGLISLPPLPTNLINLAVSNNFLTSLPTLPSTLQFISCDDNSLQLLPALPDSLRILYCMENNLQSLPSLPDSIQKLFCFNNFITTIPAIPNGLLELRCGNNPITSWPTFPNSLEYFYCNYSAAYNIPLPVLPDSLYYFNCSQNNWTSLPVLNPGLKILYCEINLLTSLPQLPPAILSLNCELNLLNSLPPLPSSLQYLTINVNPITTFPSILPDLIALQCENINLTNFPMPLPQTLKILYCSDNPLVALPDIPPALIELYCENTLVSQIPPLNINMNKVYIKDNPNLTCFPPFQNINTLQWANTPIACLPNAGFIGSASPSISGLSLCASSSSCMFNWSMYGKIYNDTNYNCLIDTTEDLFRNLRVNLKSGGNILQSMIFNTEGYFSFKTGYGNYEIELDTAGIPFDVNCPVIGKYFSNITAIDSTDENLDFGLNCKPGFFDLESKSIAPNSVFLPGHNIILHLNTGDAALFYGVNCTSGISGSVQVTLNGPVTYVSPAPGALTPSTVNFNIITWNISDFSQVNPYTDFDIVIHVDTTAIMFDTVCVNLSVAPLNDSNPSNNLLSNCFLVLASFDPNAKEVFPSGNIDTTVQWMTYTVYFQNTGNYPAQHVSIIDTIDNGLNKNSFQFLSSSHDPIIQLLPTNVIKFNFPNINLPDSLNDEPNSHGYVQYRIKTKSGLPIGTTINNTAAIYFDYNTPVLTNTVQNIISSTVSLQESAARIFKIFPNPAMNNFTIISSSTITPSALITLSDYTGKIIFKETFDETGIAIINSTNFKNGIYHVKIEGKDFVQNEKVVILK